MSSYEPPQDQAAAYHLGKLGAQLHAEREARARAEQTNAYLLSLLTEQRISPASRDLSAASVSRNKPDAELVQQLLDASEQRIEELQLELQLEKLKAGLDGDCNQTRARPSNVGLGRAVHPSSAEREATLFARKVPASRATYNSSEPMPVAMHQEKNTVVNSQGLSEATDIPTAEWMCPVERDDPKPEHTAKMRFKSYFALSSAAPAHAAHPAENIAQQVPEAQAMTSQTHALLPIPPAVSVKRVPEAECQDETTRFSRFERDPPRAPHSHGRPPPNHRPFHPGHFPHQPWTPRGPLQLPPRPPFPGTNLISYADLDRPVEPPLPLHEQPSSGYLDFDEDLYDEPSSSKVENTKTITKATNPHQVLPNSHGLKQSIHARSPYWPGFKTMVHNFRHVDIAKIPSTDSIPNLLNQITKSYFLLSVTPPKKIVRVVSPTEVETSYALTLEFARGDIAAEFVRSAEDILQKVPGCGGGFNVTQRRDRPSPLLPREVGEAVWRRGASRTLVIEEPGAALRVPANLRYQIEHCRYTTERRDGERGRGCAGECGGRLQGSPEFLQDGSIRLVFWDVRDATVAYKTWTMSPLFRHAEVSYEKDGVLPELEEEAEEGDSGVQKNTVGVVQDGDEKRDEDAKVSGSEGKHIGTRGATTSNPSSVDIEIEKEEDEGYAAGSSEDMENSIILSPKSSFPPPKNHPNTSAHHHGVDLSSNESSVDVDVEKSTMANHHAVLNYGDASDDIEEGEIREPLSTPTENSLSSGFLPPPQETTTMTSTSTLSINDVPCDPFKDLALQDRGPEKAECGESEDVKGKAASQARCVNLDSTGKLMGCSRWAAAS